MLENDIKYLNKVMKINNEDDLYNNYFCWLYPFTNENIDGYYKNIDFKNKNVLTVTSSGDHLLNASLYGSKEFDCFDTNPLAKYYVNLKIAAIKSLKYEEFIIFFFRKFINNKGYFNKNIYKKIRNNLTNDHKLFWDYFFNTYTKKDITNSFLFTNDQLSLKQLILSNKYMDKDNYYRLKEIIKNISINYYDKSFIELSNINKKYDIIILSNIIAYMNIEENQNLLIQIKNTLEKISNSNTKIVLSYLYGEKLFGYAYEGVYNKELIKKYFSKDKYTYSYFTSSDTLNQPKLLKKIYDKQDSVIISKN